MSSFRVQAGRTICVGFVLASGAALAQQNCPAGKAANGQCVNPVLFNDMRDSTTVFSQPRISETHYPLLPSNDWTLRYPNQLTISPPQVGSAGGGTRILLPGH